MARKRLPLLATICLAIAMLVPQYAMAAADSASFSLTSDKSVLNSGDEVTVTVKGSQLQDVYAYEMHVYYDSDLLTFKTGSEKTDVVGFNTPANVIADGGGESHLVFAHTKSGGSPGDSGDLDLASFTFKAAANGKADIEVRKIRLVDSGLASSTIDEHYGTSIQIGSSGGSGGSGGNGGSGGSSGGSPVESEGTLNVTPEQIKVDGTGHATISVPEAATVIKLPANTDELLGKAPLNIVTSGKAALEIPAGVFTELKKTLTAAQLQGGSISLTVKPVTAPALGTDTKLSGHSYELKLQWIAADGTAYDLHQFKEPVTLRLPVDASINPKLASIFYLPDSGTPEFVGGTYENGVYVAQLSHFSSYAVLEINKNFSDVPGSYWASGVIMELFAKQIVTGTTASTFEPNRSITRAEFTAILVRALGLKAEGTTAFTDIPAGAWYADDVAAAHKAGIVQGVSATTFSPGAKITRQEMVAIAMRGYELLNGKPAVTAAEPFKDEASISAWALEDVKKAVSLGLVKGRAEGQFVPLGTSTRAEAAQMIYGVIQ
ncbi:S-layer homology domain-containing protein [Paenibacillus glycanilyticus]|uniref:S-layer homology domain-containing protein n=1 Tax=Paenibacillus glycanilyticus TaxID=126569 RepID=UPI00203FCF7F|nr:S-layer homology domain-containing protein [Paenibacillus glycanilyticus]MCM3630218.1 S-layer homology domain-containing protein [Paenibacillus glycanilyticus]